MKSERDTLLKDLITDAMNKVQIKLSQNGTIPNGIYLPFMVFNGKNGSEFTTDVGELLGKYVGSRERGSELIKNGIEEFLENPPFDMVIDGGRIHFFLVGSQAN